MYSLGHFGMKIASYENSTPALRRGAGILDAVASSPVPLTARAQPRLAEKYDAWPARDDVGTWHASKSR